MEESKENLIPEDKLRNRDIHRTIMDGVAAAGIERDKVPAFSERLWGLSKELAALIPSEKHPSEEERKAANNLWQQAGRMNPYKEPEIIKERILQWIGARLDLGVVADEVKEKLKTLVSDLVDDEVEKHTKRKAWEEDQKRRYS